MVGIKGPIIALYNSALGTLTLLLIAIVVLSNVPRLAYYQNTGGKLGVLLGICILCYLILWVSNKLRA